MQCRAKKKIKLNGRTGTSRYMSFEVTLAPVPSWETYSKGHKIPSSTPAGLTDESLHDALNQFTDRTAVN